jgi:acetyltransferase-like isoleucine patch superfamily enzyme
MVIGRDVSVLTWTVFNVEPTGFVEIGDGSTIVGGVFMCAERISVGRGVVISYNVTIADSDFHPMRIADRRADARANAPGGDRSHRPRVSTKPVRIEDEVQVGIGAVILKGVTIGRGATIGAGSVITRDVEPGSVWEGNPGRPVPEGG